MIVQCMRVSLDAPLRTPSSLTLLEVSSLDAPLCSVDFATRNRIANLVEQYVPHMLMQSNGQSTSTLCSDRRETRPIASASRQRAATRGASRDAAAQMREAHATRSDTTPPMPLSVASIPHIRKQQHDTRSRSASQSAARALRPASTRATDRKKHASRNERRRAQHRMRQDTQTHMRD